MLTLRAVELIAGCNRHDSSSRMGEKATLLKFGKYKHLSQLRSEGLLFLNTLRYFWEIEDGGLRGDPYDGVDRVARGDEGQLMAKDRVQIPLRITDWALRIHPPGPQTINLFCMYACRPAIGTFPVDERIFDFGDHVLVVTKPQQFIDAVALTLKGQCISARGGLVQYVDDDHTGPLGPLRKRERFSYQSEWRIVCYDGPGGARKFQIGSIADYSKLIPAQDVNRELDAMLAV